MIGGQAQHRSNDQALKLFNAMPMLVEVTWNSVISGFVI